MSATRKKQKAAIETLKRAQPHTRTNLLLDVCHRSIPEVRGLSKSLAECIPAKSRAAMLTEMVAELPDDARKTFEVLLPVADQEESVHRDRVAADCTERFVERVLADHYSRRTSSQDTNHQPKCT